MVSARLDECGGQLRSLPNFGAFPPLALRYTGGLEKKLGNGWWNRNALFLAALLLIGGVLGDLYGRRKDKKKSIIDTITCRGSSAG